LREPTIMTGVPSPELKAYFAEARSWEQDRLAEALRSKRLAWAAAAGSMTLTIVAVGAVAALAPLKSVEPFVVRVDRATGSVDVMSGLKDGRELSYEEAVSKYFLGVYVRAREAWLPAAGEANFSQVSIMSAPEEQQRWAKAFAPTNPASPQLAYGPNGQVEVAIRAISFLNPKVANVRFHRVVRQGPQTSESDWISTIAFTYTSAPMLEADRLRNPLGFQVTSYRADPEVAR
jgi:type IV secretion system protein VirB8